MASAQISQHNQFATDFHQLHLQTPHEAKPLDVLRRDIERGIKVIDILVVPSMSSDLGDCSFESMFVRTSVRARCHQLSQQGK